MESTLVNLTATYSQYAFVVNKKAMENKVNLKLQTVNGKNKDKKSKEKKDNCDLELMRKEG